MDLTGKNSSSHPWTVRQQTVRNSPRPSSNGLRTQFLQPWTRVLVLILIWGEFVHGIIIPPKWANVTLNPCAKKSWQLLYWPNDQKCYRIFAQGPCEETQEFYFDDKLGLSSCRCARGTLWHSMSRKCHREFSKGPCQHGEYLEKSKIRSRGADYAGVCQPYQDCPPGFLFWPPTKKCYPLLSRGPCLHGQLLYVNPETGVMDCGCERSIMNTNYWLYEDSCHELYTRGPCIQGHIFIYNLKKGQTECVCEPHLKTNYHQETGQCYELNTPGPCKQGQVFALDTKNMEALCMCLPDFVEWKATGQCYREYTQGPCPQSHFLHTDPLLGGGACRRKMCLQGQLYDPGTDFCYPVGRRGPCPRGKIWVFERATSVKGMCHCDPQLVGYWEPHETCYELGERGPCTRNKVLSYNKVTRKLACKCDYRRGYVAWANGGCLKRGLTRKIILPVIGPTEDSILGNSILSKRIHRGLTLPLREGIKNSTLNSANSVQERILNDIHQNIKNKNCSSKIEADACAGNKMRGQRFGRRLPHNPRKAMRVKSPPTQDEPATRKLEKTRINSVPAFEALKITTEVSRITSRVSSSSSRGRNFSGVPRTRNAQQPSRDSSRSKKLKERNRAASSSAGQFPRDAQQNRQSSRKVEKIDKNPQVAPPEVSNAAVANLGTSRQVFAERNQPPSPKAQRGSGSAKTALSKDTKDLLQQILQRRLMKIRRKSEARSLQREELKRRRQQRHNLHLRKAKKRPESTRKRQQIES